MTSEKTRFSKKTMLEYLREREERLRAQGCFDHGNGTAQVQGRGEKINLLYGEWKTVSDIIIGIHEGWIP